MLIYIFGSILCQEEIHLGVATNRLYTGIAFILNGYLLFQKIRNLVGVKHNLMDG